MWIKDRASFHTSLVVLLIDDFTGRPVTDRRVKAVIPGQKPPVVKSDGYCVFVNLTEPEVTLCCESRAYLGWSGKVALTGKGAQDVFLIRLLPGAGYHAPGGTVCVSGRTQPGRRILFWENGAKGYRLLCHYGGTEGTNPCLIDIYHTDGREIRGKGFIIFGNDRKKKEYFKIVDTEGKHYRMDRGLSREYPRTGTVILPVWEAYADETGEFFLPVARRRQKEMELVCRPEGEEEKTFLLLPGKGHAIVP